jgi:hypothetical protein
MVCHWYPVIARRLMGSLILEIIRLLQLNIDGPIMC